MLGNKSLGGVLGFFKADVFKTYQAFYPQSLHAIIYLSSLLQDLLAAWQHLHARLSLELLALRWRLESTERRRFFGSLFLGENPKEVVCYCDGVLHF